jgi:hypothetical protein
MNPADVVSEQGLSITSDRPGSSVSIAGATERETDVDADGTSADGSGRQTSDNGFADVVISSAPEPTESVSESSPTLTILEVH